VAFIGFHWWSIRSPAAKAEWERELSQRLGLAVAIEGLSYPQPSVAELAGVKISDAETGLLLAECRRAEIVHAGGKWNVTLIEPSAERDELSRRLHRLYDRLFLADFSSLRLAATQLTLRHDGAAHSLHDFATEVDASPTGPTARLRFALAPADAACEITLRRNRQIAPPATQIEWKCPAPLPAELAGGLLGDSIDLGPQATLSGSGNFIWSEKQLRGELSGEIAGIDLARVVSEKFPHSLTGQATLTLKRAMFENGRLTSARGTLVVEGGRISRSLLTAAEEHLELRAELPPEEIDSVAYQRLALGFELTGEQLRLTGIVGDAGVLMTQAAGALLSVPENHQAPAVALVRMLVPDSQVQVPATKQTAALLRWLPIPSIDPPASKARSSHVPTRLGPAAPAERNGNVIRERDLR
jgi:hypothetical protein